MRASAFVLLASLSLAGPAAAQDIFRYVKADGTVTYTDSLAALPPAVRAQYNEKIAAREAAQAELEKNLGPEEVARRQAEAEKQRLLQEQLDEAERREKMAAIDARLKQIAEADKRKSADKHKWQERVRAARANLQRLFRDFQAAEAKFNDLGTRASFSLLPGQAEELQAAQEAMAKLGPQIDLAIAELEQKIPEEARRAGVPPGWLRDA